MFKRLLTIMLALMAAAAFAAVDVNKATQADLDGIKGIGPAIAGKILDERKKGNFKDWNDFIERVKGVGEGNAAKFSAEGLTVNGSAFKGVAAAPAAKKDEKPAAAAAPAPAAKKDDKAMAPPAAAAPAAAAKPAADAKKPDAKADAAAEKKAKAEADKKAKEEAKAKKEADKKAKAEAAKKAKEDKKAKKDDKPAAAAAAASAPKKP